MIKNAIHLALFKYTGQIFCLRILISSSQAWEVWESLSSHVWDLKHEKIENNEYESLRKSSYMDTQLHAKCTYQGYSNKRKTHHKISQVENSYEISSILSRENEQYAETNRGT